MSSDQFGTKTLTKILLYFNILTLLLTLNLGNS